MVGLRRDRVFHLHSRIELVGSTDLRDLLWAHAERRRMWSAPGHDAEAAINATSGPLVEIGGPSFGDWSFPNPRFVFDPKKLERPIHISNVVEDPDIAGWHPKFRIPWQPRIKYATDRVEFLADARNMPIPDSSLGAVFTANLPGAAEFGGLRSDFIHEAARVVEPGGLVVFHGARAIDIEEAAGLDLHPIRLRGEQVRAWGGGWVQKFDFIAQKPASVPDR